MSLESCPEMLANLEPLHHKLMCPRDQLDVIVMVELLIVSRKVC